MSDILVSVVIANYNYGRFLEEAIRSVLSQKCSCKYELIICDGGSTDNSVDIIKRYADNLAWWCSEKDKGQSDAFNKGFSHARGRFLTWLNADDMMLPGTLEAVEQLAKDPGIEWISGGMVFCDAEMNVQQMRIGTCPPFGMPWDWLSMTIIGGPSSFFSASRFKEIGGIDVNLRYAMDGDLWWRLFKSGVKLHHANKYFWAFRLHEASKTSPALLRGSLGDKHAKENAYLTKKNFRPRWKAALGLKLTAIWKLANGSIIKSWVDTSHYRGRPVRMAVGG